MGKKRKRSRKQNAIKEAASEGTSTLLRILKFIGIVFTLGGISMMALSPLVPSFWLPGVILAVLGFVALIGESCEDPLLVAKRYAVQVAVVLAEVILFAFFVVEFVVIPNTVGFQALTEGGHGSDISISGIQWDSRLTDLRVAVINPTGDDLNKVDFTVIPNYPVYRAALVNDISDCRLTVVQGGDVLTIGDMPNTSTSLKFERMPLGDGYTYQDDRGTIYTTVLTNKGYRLICSSIPPHFTLQLVFAVGQPTDEEKQANNNLKNGQWSVALFGVNGPVPALLDSLGPRPYPNSVRIVGNYIRRFKPFSLESVISVLAAQWSKQP